MQKLFMGIGKAIEYIENIGIENIEKYLKQLTKYTINILKEKIKNIKIYRTENTCRNSIIYNR